MPLMRWGLSGRIKDVQVERVAEYQSYGWVMCDDGIREPVEIPAPVVEQSPLEKLEEFVNDVVYAKETPKRKAGRPPKKRR